MKLLSFERNGESGFGMLVPGGVIDLAARTDFADLASALPHVDQFAAFADNAPDFPLSDVVQLCPIPLSKRITCVGLNYKTHIAETGRDMPAYPMLFFRFPDSLVGDGEPLLMPIESDWFDFEGEFAFVIGKPGRRIAAERALEHVAGYTIVNDGSVRDYQRHTSQYSAGKNFPRSGSCGPWLVTPDEFGDIASQTIETRLNGTVMQQSRLDDLLFGVPELIAYISSLWPMQSGDIVATGTPGGVGFFRKPPLWMKAGDTVEIEVSNIGTLSNGITSEKAG